MITPEEKKEMLTIFRKHYDNLKMRCDIDNATLMLAILPAMQEYAKSNIPAVIKSVCGDCIYYLTCNSESRDKQICYNYDNEP
jgi:hypothetical protein